MSLKLCNYIYKKFSVNVLLKGGRNRMGRITVHHRDQNVPEKNVI